MNFIDSESAESDIFGALYIVFAIIIILAIVVWKWDIISDAISQFHSATCVNTPNSWNNC